MTNTPLSPPLLGGIKRGVVYFKERRLATFEGYEESLAGLFQHISLLNMNNYEI
jgi:hypothetical protein